MKIHHIGLVVSNLDQTLEVFGLSRADVSESVYDPLQQNTLHFVHLRENNCWLEFVEPMSPTASTANFAVKYGMGLHHIGFNSDDLAASEQQHASREGAFKLGQYQIEVLSFGGHIRTLFIAVRGLILEYVKHNG